MELDRAKQLEINDKSLFDDYFLKYPPETSEFTFTNLFMWRKVYDFLFMEWKKHLLIFSNTYFKKKLAPFSKDPNSVLFFPPIGPEPNKITIELFKSLKNIEIHRAPEFLSEGLRNNEEATNLNIEILEDRNNWDYVYPTEDLKELAGNKYRQNRRWLTKFLENYEYEFEMITTDLVEKCKKLQLEWCIMKGCEEDEDLEEEQKAIYDALDNLDTLNFKGAMICVDDKCVAYTFGEMLNSNTLVIHIEKAHMEYEGSYQAIANLFLKSCCGNAIFVNREQDLGIPGLRRAKESYKPSHMVKKSIIYQKS